MSLVAVSAVGTNVLEQRMAANLRDSVVARHASITGLQVELRRLAVDGCATAEGFNDEFSPEPSAPVPVVGGGHFSALLMNNPSDPGLASGEDTDGAAILRVIGTAGPGGAGEGPARSIVEAVIQRPIGETDLSVLTGGDLRITGAVNISGCRANVHSNGDVVIDGNGVFAGTVYAQGEISVVNGTLEAGERSGVPAMVLPTLDTAALGSGADFVLTADGYVTDVTGGPPLHTPAEGPEWQGWAFSGAAWTLAGDFTRIGVFHVQGDAVIAGSPGSAGTPWRASVIADGNLQVLGRVQMAAAAITLQLGDGFDNVLLVAGGDLRIAADPGSQFIGVVAAREQLLVEGFDDLRMSGPLLGLDAASNSILVEENLLTGALTLEQDPDAAALPLQPIAWRRVLR
jgi:hypothetical protein